MSSMRARLEALEARQPPPLTPAEETVMEGRLRIRTHVEELGAALESHFGNRGEKYDLCRRVCRGVQTAADQAIIDTLPPGPLAALGLLATSYCKLVCQGEDDARYGGVLCPRASGAPPPCCPTFATDPRDGSDVSRPRLSR